MKPTVPFSSKRGILLTLPIAPTATCGGKITGLAYVPPNWKNSLADCPTCHWLT